MWVHLHHAHEVLDRRLQRLHLLALGPLLDLRRLRREALPLLRPYLLHPTHPVAQPRELRRQGIPAERKPRPISCRHCRVGLFVGREAGVRT